MKQQPAIIVQTSNNGVSRITLNESKTYNALSLNTLNLLIKAFQNFHEDEKTRVIIIEGSVGILSVYKLLNLFVLNYVSLWL